MCIRFNTVALTTFLPLTQTSRTLLDDDTRFAVAHGRLS